MDTPDDQLEWHQVLEARTMGLNFLSEGELAMVALEGYRICVARKGDRLFAVRNRCPHSGGPLAQGHIDAEGLLVCPWHRFRFCLDANETGPDGYRLHSYPIEIRDDQVFIGLPKRKKFLGLF